MVSALFLLLVSVCYGLPSIQYTAAWHDVMSLVATKFASLPGTPSKFRTLQTGECMGRESISNDQMAAICAAECLDFIRSKVDDVEKCMEKDMAGDACVSLMGDIEYVCSDIVSMIKPVLDNANCKVKAKKECCADPNCAWVSLNGLKSSSSKFSTLDSAPDLKLKDALKLVCAKSDSNKYCAPSVLDATLNSMCGITTNMTTLLNVACNGCIQQMIEVMSIPELSGAVSYMCSSDNGNYCFVGDGFSPSGASQLQQYMENPRLLPEKCFATCPPNMIFTETAHYMKSMNSTPAEVQMFANLSRIICQTDVFTGSLCYSTIMDLLNCTDPDCNRMCNGLKSRVGPGSDCCPRAVLATLKSIDQSSYNATAGMLHTVCNITYEEGTCAPGMKVPLGVNLDANCDLIAKKEEIYRGLAIRDLESDFRCIGCVSDVHFECASSSPSSSKLSVLSTDGEDEDTPEGTTIGYSVQGLDDEQSYQYATMSDTATSRETSLLETKAQVKKDQANASSSVMGATVGSLVAVLVATVLLI